MDTGAVKMLENRLVADHSTKMRWESKFFVALKGSSDPPMEG